jgi:hypothetical protein
MNLRARSVTESDFPDIYRFIFETFGFTGIYERTFQEWQAFYKAKQERNFVMLGIIVEDVEIPSLIRPVAYQQIRFVSEQFVESYRSNMRGWLLAHAKELFDDGFLPGLTESELLQANEFHKVNIYIDYYGWDISLSERDAALARDFLYQSFQYLCRGYNLQTILKETIGPESMGTLLARNSGLQRVRDLPDGPIFHEVTREQALNGVARGSMIAALFAGGTPRLQLSSFDRCLIIAALWGFSDADLARRWPCGEDAIAGYWRRIYRQAQQDVPEIFAKIGAKASGKRGPERKEPFLSFIRNNPHELGPVVYLPPEWRDPQRSRCSSTKAKAISAKR